MENENKNKSNLKGMLNRELDETPNRFDFNKNKSNNNKILEKNINFKNKSNFDNNNNNENININYNDMNNNIDNVMNEMKMNEVIEPLESTLSSNLYEKNIAILNDKIKEQENEIKYLNERLKNYDTTMDEMANLNIELNRLNDIIRNKNKTI